MSINKIYQFFVAAILLCGANVMLTSCEETHDYINIRYI